MAHLQRNIGGYTERAKKCLDKQGLFDYNEAIMIIE